MAASNRTEFLKEFFQEHFGDIRTDNKINPGLGLIDGEKVRRFSPQRAAFYNEYVVAARDPKEKAARDIAFNIVAQNNDRKAMEDEQIDRIAETIRYIQSSDNPALKEAVQKMVKEDLGIDIHYNAGEVASRKNELRKAKEDLEKRIEEFNSSKAANEETKTQTAVQLYYDVLDHNEKVDKLVGVRPLKLGKNEAGTSQKILTNSLKVDTTLVYNFAKIKKQIGIQAGGGGDSPNDPILQRIANYEKMLNTENPNTLEKIKNILKYDPAVSVKNIEPNNSDRIIFIIFTYFLQTIALFFVEWMMTINLVTYMSQAVLVYLIAYLCIFALVVGIVAFAPMSVSNMLFMFSLRVPQGAVRALLHTVPYFFMFVLWSVLKMRQIENSYRVLTFMERKKLLRQLNKITFALWVITSGVAFAK